MLIRSGFPPIVIRVTDRKRYFAELEKAHFGNLKHFIDFIAFRVEESLILYLNSFVKTSPYNELISLQELVKGTSYSQEYVSLLARKGILPATKIQGVWHSSKKELEKYKYALKKKN